MRKKPLVTIFATVAVFSLSLGIVACGGGKKKTDNDLAKFQTNVDNEVYVGDEVDLEEYIVRVDSSTTEIVVEYKEETISGMKEREEIFLDFDTVFYPKEAGEHTLTYTVTTANAVGSNSMTLNVKAKLPEIVMKDIVPHVQLTKKQPVRDVSLYPILTGELSVFLRYTEQDMPDLVAFDLAENYDPDLSEEEQDYNRSFEVDPNDPWSWAIDTAGMYRGTLRATSDAGTTDKAFYMLVEKGEINRSYKSRMDENGNVTIQPGSYGKDGDAWTTNYGYYGLGMYEMGDTLTFHFTGKNIPNVAIFTDVPSGQPIGDGAGMYIQTSNNSAAWSKRVSIASPYRLETGNLKDYDKNGDGITTVESTAKRDENGNIVYQTDAEGNVTDKPVMVPAEYDKHDLGKTQNNWAQIMSNVAPAGSTPVYESKFGYLTLEDDVNYRYTIQTEDAGINVVKLTLTLEKEVEGVYEVVETVTKTGAHGLDVPAAKNGLQATQQTYAIAYSAGSAIGKSITFSYDIDSDGKRYQGVDRDSDSLELKLPKTQNSDVSYYGMGQMITKQVFETTFVGDNMPDVALFADTVGGQPTEGTGLFVTLTQTGMEVYKQRKNGLAWSLADETAIKTGDLQADTQYSMQITHQKVGEKIKLTFVLSQWNESAESYDEIKRVTTTEIDFDISKIANKHAIVYGKAGRDISCTAKLITVIPDGATILKKGTDNYSPKAGEIYTDWSYVATEKMTLDKKISVHFMGKNIPNLMLLSDSNEGQAYGGGKGYVFVAAQSNANFRKRFHACGPNRLVADANGIFGRKDGSTETIIGSGGNEACAWDNLQDDTDYVLSAWVTKSTSKIIEGVDLHYELHTADGVKVFGTSVHVEDDYAKTLFKKDGDSYHAILYGNRITDIMFTYEITTLPPVEDDGKTHLAKGTDNYKVGTIFTKWDYTATDKLASGDKLVINFKGKNVPNVVLCADSNEGQAYGGGKGWLFVFAQSNPGFTHRVSISGSNRANVDASAMIGRGEGSLYNGGTSDAAAWKNLDDNTDYTLTLSATKVETGVQLVFSLVNADTGEKVQERSHTATDEYATGLYQNATDGYHAILYGNSIAEIAFTYEIKKA